MDDRFKFRAWDKGSGLLDPIMYFFDLTEDNRWILEKNCPIMQSAGLRDKNETLIFEGDLVRSMHGSHTPAEVKWGLFSEDGDHPKSLGYLLYDDCLLGTDIEGREGNHLEVIGNIYEHPELIPARIESKKKK